MQEISTLGSSVWGPNSPAAESIASQSAAEAEDNLPPFTVLTTDEEREQKAGKSSPGTFHVVVNPDSFSHLPEYSDDGIDSASAPYASLRRGSLASIHGKAGSDGLPFSAESPDPNTVILSRFEDSTRRSTGLGKGKQSTITPVLTHTLFPPTLTGLNLTGGVPDGLPDGMPDGVPDGIPHGLPDGLSDGLPGFDPSQSLINIAAAGGQDSGLLNHFRTKIWSQMVQIDIIRKDSMVQAPGMDLFESEAALFPPVSVVPPQAHLSLYPVYFDDFLRDSDWGE